RHDVDGRHGPRAPRLDLAGVRSLVRRHRNPVPRDFHPMNPTMTALNPQALEPLRGWEGRPCLLYPASRALDDAAAASLLAELRAFLGGWASHGAPVRGAGTVLENRFVVVAHDLDEIAGCSRDALM